MRGLQPSPRCKREVDAKSWAGADVCSVVCVGVDLSVVSVLDLAERKVVRGLQPCPWYESGIEALSGGGAPGGVVRVGGCVDSVGMLCMIEVADVPGKEAACVLESEEASVLVGVSVVVEVACLWLTYCGSSGRNNVLMGVVFGVGNMGVLGLG